MANTNCESKAGKWQDKALAILRPWLIDELAEAIDKSFEKDWYENLEKNCDIAVEGARLMEIRLRLGQQVRLRPVREEVGEITLPLVWRHEQQKRQLMAFLRNSVYAYEEQLRQGFVTLPGGHRVGMVGEVWLENGHIGGFREISGMNIRLARAVPGVALPFMRYVISGGRVLRTLIASPPAVGKTTLLRDMVRLLGEGVAGLLPQNMGLADERMEIAAVYQGEAQLDVGSRCDVISACPKAEAIMMLLRSMGPQVIVTDEIGSAADRRALAEVLNAGVSVIASAHGGSLAELRMRPEIRELLEQGFFERVILLRRSSGKLLPEKVYDGAGREILC